MSISKASSKASTSSTRPSESAPRSSMKVDSGLMSFSSTSSCSLMIRFTSAVMSRPSAMVSSPGGASTKEVCPLLCVYRFVRKNPEKLHIHAAIHAQGVAGHVGRFVGGEVHHRGGDFARRPRATERNGRRDAGLLRVGQGRGHVGVDEARGHGVDRDVP